MDPAGEDPFLGRRCGNFVLEELLGEGGFARVYRARHAELGAQMAVKMLHARIAAEMPEVVQRFLLEARTGSQQIHPRIVRVVDFGRFETGEPWLMMEFLDGRDVEKLVREQGPLALPTALSILAQACDGLHVAHERGIVHRDLKPQNLMVLDATGEVKILDFGIAKVTDQAIAGDVRTRTGQVAGSFGFMAPEQARSMGRADRRADVFSMGAVAYYMLTGALPFGGESITDYALNVLHTRPEDPRVRRPDLPESWMYTIMQALSPEPDDRPQTALELARRLVPDVLGGAELVKRVAPAILDAPPTSATVQARADLGPGLGGDSTYSSPPYGSGGPPTAPGTQFAAAHTRQTMSGGPGRSALWLAIAAVAVAAAVVVVVMARGSSGAAGVAPRDAATAAGSTDASATATTRSDAAQVAAAMPPDAPAPPDAPLPDAPRSPDARSTGTSHHEHHGTGILAVHVSPWASVYVDGKLVGTTPVSHHLSAGRHKVLLVNADNGRREPLAVTITAGHTTTIERSW